MKVPGGKSTGGGKKRQKKKNWTDIERNFAIMCNILQQKKKLKEGGNQESIVREVQAMR